MEKLILSSAFKLRLTRFERELCRYHETGEIGNLIPLLFQLASYCWCKSPVIRKSK